MVSDEYLAGFVDGEGSLSLARRHRPRQSTEYSVRIAIYNSHRGVLEEIRRGFGGTWSDVGTRYPHWKPAFALIWTNAAAVELLTKLAPYLRVKSEHAKVLFRFVEHVQRCKRTRDARGYLSSLAPQKMRVRERFHRQLKHLNARGSASVSLRPRSSTAGRRPRKQTNLSAEYLAGFVDAEGSLMISKSINRENQRPTYGTRMAVSNTDRCSLEEIRRIFGGKLMYQPARNSRWRDAYQLVWSGGMSRRLLPIIAPYLRVKRTQAAVMEEFTRHQETVWRENDGRHSARLSDDVLALREGMYQRMKILNAKGPAHAGANLNP